MANPSSWSQARRQSTIANEVYCSPHMSFPDYFVAASAAASLRGRPFPAIAHAEQWRASVYGSDWQRPRRNRALGGPAQAHRNIYGHRIVPRLPEEIAWCVERGWDRRVYSACPPWPRQAQGGGPIGPTPRTEDNSRSLWWRDLDEMVRFF